MPVRKKGEIETAVRLSVRVSQLDKRDRATAFVAFALAQEIDSGTVDIIKASQTLLTYLDALLLTPRARNQVLKGGVKTDDKPSSLDEIAERRARKSRAASVDEATS